MDRQTDVTPALIMSRVEAASGARYSAHKEQARKVEPIAPVGTNYTPIGKVDISALRNAPSPAAKPVSPSAASRPTYGVSKPSPSAGSLYGRTIIQGSAPQDSWPEEEKSTATPPPPPPPRPVDTPPPAFQPAPRPAFSATVRPSCFHR